MPVGVESGETALLTAVHLEPHPVLERHIADGLRVARIEG